MDNLDGISLSDLYTARRTIGPWTVQTPLVAADALSRHVGGQVLLKLETLQPTGSFKIRGATNRLEHLTASQRERDLDSVGRKS